MEAYIPVKLGQAELRLGSALDDLLGSAPQYKAKDRSWYFWICCTIYGALRRVEPDKALEFELYAQGINLFYS